MNTHEHFLRAVRLAYAVLIPVMLSPALTAFAQQPTGMMARRDVSVPNTSAGATTSQGPTTPSQPCSSASSFGHRQLFRLIRIAVSSRGQESLTQHIPT